MCVSWSFSWSIWEGKGKCFRGKWISSRMQRRHSKQPSHTHGWRWTIHMYMKERERDRERERERQQMREADRQGDRS